MRVQRWRKWVMAAAIAGMLVGQTELLTVQAAEVSASAETSEEETVPKKVEEQGTITEEPTDAAKEVGLSDNQEEVMAQSAGITWTMDGDTLIMREDGSPVNPGIRSFVERCYTKVLGRAGEKAGIEDWTNRIATGQMSAEDVAKSFFFSDEYTNKNTDNETFVETLYQTFMDRASDPAGKSDWVGRLGAGTSREEVLEGFSRSGEFAGILAGYGL